MRPTTTEKHTLKFPINLDNIDDLKITYSQDSSIVIVKELDDVTVSGNTIIVTLTESETKNFEPEIAVEIQAKLLIDDDVIPTQITRIPVKRMLNVEIFGGAENE